LLLGTDDFDSLLEILKVLGDPEEVEAIRAGLADLGHGGVNSAKRSPPHW